MIYPRVRDHVEFDELVALGNAGLAEAAQRFDPSRGVPFGAFAWYRVQGAVLDGMRQMTQLPKRVWAGLVALRAASEYLEHRIEREAGAAKTGASPPTGADALAAVKSAMSAIRTMYVTSLDAMTEEVSADSQSAPDRIDAQRIAAKLRDALGALPERERALMTKHYWEGKTLLEAGAELGISKSWASRLHAQAVDRIRALVDDDS
jgi:RNA polymerase sigma factor for flagellar operon FliA